MADPRDAVAAFTPTARRRVRAAPHPTLSLVVAWLADQEALSSCLDRIADTARRHGVEVVVTVPEGAIDVDRMAARFPKMLLETSAADSTADLRRAGMSAAGGDIVLVSDHRRPPTAGWLVAALENVDRPSDDSTTSG